MTLNFTRACYAKDPSGEDQIVLESDPIDEPPDVPPGKPLAPLTAPPLWQVLVIQLHWRTTAAGNRDSLVADNAVLHWYVYGKPDEDGAAMLHYLGNGAVSVSTGNSGADVVIHNAEMLQVERFGHFQDPLQDFHINASFHAANDADHLKEIMSDLNKAIGEAKAK